MMIFLCISKGYFLQAKPITCVFINTHSKQVLRGVKDGQRNLQNHFTSLLEFRIQLKGPAPDNFTTPPFKTHWEGIYRSGSPGEGCLKMMAPIQTFYPQTSHGNGKQRYLKALYILQSFKRNIFNNEYFRKFAQQ